MVRVIDPDGNEIDQPDDGPCGDGDPPEPDAPTEWERSWLLQQLDSLVLEAK